MLHKDDLCLAPFDSLTTEQRHDRLLGFFVAETYRQRENRHRMARCEAYYDQYQYSARDKATLEARGQYAITFDRIAPQIDWLIGTERRTRIDFRVDPRNSVDQEALQDADNRTKLLKWLDDTGDSAFHRSRSFAAAMKAGLGWVEVGADMDNSGETPVFETALSWREMVHDSYAMDPDPRRWRYNFRVKVVDLDIAAAYFPKKIQEIMRVAQDASELDAMRPWISSPGSVLDLEALFGNTAALGFAQDQAIMPHPLMFNSRKRAMLIEAWSMQPVRMRPDGRVGGLSDPIRMVPHVTIMTEYVTLWEGWSPYRHGRYPFVPMWAYMEQATGLPYSPVRRAMDKQDGLNRAMSRAHHEIASTRIEAEEGAFNGPMTAEEVREEVDDPEGIVILGPGGLDKFRVVKGFEKAEAHMAMADRYAAALDESSAITRENRGSDGAPLSGKARQIKQDQGTVMTAELFDNLLLAQKWIGEIKLSVAEQYVVDPIVVPTTGDRGQRQMIELNQQQPDGTWRNDITARKGRFVISEQPWRQNMMAAQFDSLMDVLGQIGPVAPQVVIALLDVVFELADLPNKTTVLERIRAISGQPGPDERMTPEQQAQKERAAVLANAQFEAQLATLKAQAAEAQGKGEKLNAEAVMKGLETLYTAAQAAQVLQLNPGAAPIADELLKSAGFADKHPAASIEQAAGLPAAGQPPQTARMPVEPGPAPVSPLAGHQTGIETPAADGGQTPPMEAM